MLCLIYQNQIGGCYGYNELQRSRRIFTAESLDDETARNVPINTAHKNGQERSIHKRQN